MTTASDPIEPGEGLGHEIVGDKNPLDEQPTSKPEMTAASLQTEGPAVGPGETRANGTSDRPGSTESASAVANEQPTKGEEQRSEMTITKDRPKEGEGEQTKMTVTTESPPVTRAPAPPGRKRLGATTFRLTRKQRLGVAIAVLVVVVTAAGTLIYKHVVKASTTANVLPLSITPAPAGLIGGTTPSSDGGLWVLVNVNGRANVQEVNTSGKATPVVFPVSNTASSIATNYGNDLGIGLASGKTGAVQFFSTDGMAPLGSVPVAGPVTALVGGDNGDVFYALISIKGVESADVINSRTFKVTATVPLPSLTDSIAVSPDGQAIYALQDNGTVAVIDIASKTITQAFTVVPGDRQIAISPDGSTLYVLKGTLASDNVAVINILTETTSYVLPAPVSTQGITVSPQGDLYDIVGNPQYGNVQVFSTAKPK